MACEREAYATAVKYGEVAVQLASDTGPFLRSLRKYRVGRLLKHMRVGRKMHLAWRDLDDLAGMRNPDESERAFERILRWALLLESGEDESALVEAQSAAETLGGAIAKLLLHAVAVAAKVSADSLPPALSLFEPPPALGAAAGLLKAKSICVTNGIQLYCCAPWEPTLVESFRQEMNKIDSEGMRQLCMSAHRLGMNELLYLSSGVGLAGGKMPEWFLFYRSLTFNWWTVGRRRACWQLACALAIERADRELIEAMEEVAHARRSQIGPDEARMLEYQSIPYDGERLAEVIRTESALLDYPIRGAWSAGDDHKTGAYEYQRPVCDCHFCQARREQEERGIPDGSEMDDDCLNDDYDDYDDYDDECDGYEGDEDYDAPAPLPQWAIDRLNDLSYRHRKSDGSYPEVEELYELAPGEMVELSRDIMRYDEAGMDPPGAVPGVQSEGRRQKARAERKRRRNARKRQKKR